MSFNFDATTLNNNNNSKSQLHNRDRYDIWHTILMSILEGRNSKKQIEFAAAVSQNLLNGHLRILVESGLITGHARPMLYRKSVWTEDFTITEKGYEVALLLSDLLNLRPPK